MGTSFPSYRIPLHKFEETNMRTDVYLDDKTGSIPAVEVDIILVLADYESANLSAPSARREIARKLHRMLLAKNYVVRQKRDSGT
tara:strand:+ start:536 stop:790 length:255 start_codon:yes stop_codon:yes gene_type:complete